MNAQALFDANCGSEPGGLNVLQQRRTRDDVKAREPTERKKVVEFAISEVNVNALYTAGEVKPLMCWWCQIKSPGITSH